jgi:hypothetical protein
MSNEDVQGRTELYEKEEVELKMVERHNAEIEIDEVSGTTELSYICVESLSITTTECGGGSVCQSALRSTQLVVICHERAQFRPQSQIAYAGQHAKLRVVTHHTRVWSEPPLTNMVKHVVRTFSDTDPRSYPESLHVIT